MSCFFVFSFSFFFYKIAEQESRREMLEKVGRRVNSVQNMFTHVKKFKNDTLLKLLQESREGE
jgi:hypothetical protein